tara:strand:- start:99 stop:212 length:114 start_codon:yes stop_codon:yes gene_type:complete
MEEGSGQKPGYWRFSVISGHARVPAKAGIGVNPEAMP